MDIQQQNRPRLEPIQEESEHEDETEGSKKREGNEDDFPFQVGVETEDALAEDESDEDDGAAQLRVLRPRRLSRSSQDNFSQMQLLNNQHEETESFSVSGLSTYAFDLRDEGAAPRQPTSTNMRRSSSGKLRAKVSKVKLQKQTQPKLPVQKPMKTSKKELVAEEPLPQWLMDLMVNIEEATTHQLVVE